MGNGEIPAEMNLIGAMVENTGCNHARDYLNRGLKIFPIGKILFD